MESINQNELIEKHIGQVNKLAWHFAKTTGKDFDDFKSEGIIGMIRAIKKFDESKGYELSTLIHISAKNAMVTYYKKQLNTGMELPEDMESKQPSKIRRFEFMDTLKSLGNEAKQILGIIFAAPGEVLNIASDCSPFQVLFPAPAEILNTIDNDSVCHARMAIKKYMKEIGFSQDEIRYGINEIRSTFIQ